MGRRTGTTGIPARGTAALPSALFLLTLVLLTLGLPAVLLPPMTAAAAERLKMQRTHDGDARAFPYDPDPPPAVAEPRPPWQSKNRIVYAFDRPARSRLAYSAELSTACRRGEFLQRVDMLYRAFGPGEQPLGVAYGAMAINLIDPKRRRQADMVYFFHRQDTGRCAVYEARQETLRPWFVGP